MRRAVFSSGAIVCLLLIAQFWMPAFFATADSRAFDLLASLTNTSELTRQVVIVAIDEPSLQRFGRWPWPRDLVALLIGKLFTAGARAVVLDVMFIEPDNSLPAIPRLVRQGLLNSYELSAARNKTNDELLIDAVRSYPVISGYSFDFQSNLCTPDCVLQSLSLATIDRPGATPPSLFLAPGVLCPLPGIAGATAATGFLNAAPDSDGVLRRVPLIVRHKDRLYPSLALAGLLAFRPGLPLSLHSGPLGTYELGLGPTRVPIDNHGAMLLRFPATREQFRSVSAADTVMSPAAASAVAGKIAILGGAAAGIEGFVSTPNGPVTHGVEVHAAAIDTLLSGDFISRPPYGPALELAAVLLAIAAVTLALSFLPPLAGAPAALALIPLLWFASSATLTSWRIFISPVSPSLAVLAALILVTASNWSRHTQGAAASRAELESMRRFTLAAMSEMVRARDVETGRHARRLQSYMQMLCDSLRTHPRFKSFLTPQTITLLIELTPIHDIGKVGIPDSILLKNGPLTPGEYSTMKQHAEHGRRILDRARLSSGLLDSQVFQIARAMVSGHHEHWDGSGYPDGLRGDEIPIPARMLAVADVFDALVSRRVYKDAIDPIAATEIIRNGRATKFDPDIVDALLAHQADWQKIALQWHDRTTPPQTKAASAGA